MNLKGRDFLTLKDFTPEEITYLIDLSAELKAKKDAIFAKNEYGILANDEAFKALISNAAKFTVEEIEEKAKAIFADYVIKTGTFSVNNGEGNKPKSIGLNINDKPNKKRQAYGGLFDVD